MEHAITQSQDPSQTVTRKLLIFVGMIAYTVLILQIMALPTKHALSPLFPAFTVPELETSSQTHSIDMTRIQSHDDVSMMEGESDHGFTVEQLGGNVEKHGNMDLQTVAEMRDTQQSEKQAETSIEDEGMLLLHSDSASSNKSSMPNTKDSVKEIDQDVYQQTIQI